MCGHEPQAPLYSGISLYISLHGNTVRALGCPIKNRMYDLVIVTLGAWVDNLYCASIQIHYIVYQAAHFPLMHAVTCLISFND